MRMAAGQHRRAVPAQHPRERRVGCRGNDTVGVAARLAVEAEQRRIIAQGQGERGLEGAEVGQVLEGELRGAPLLDLEESTAFLIARRQPDGADGHGVGIVKHDRTAQLTEPHGDLMGLGPMAATLPKHSTRSAPAPAKSASTASNAVRLPWISAMTAMRMDRCVKEHLLFRVRRALC